MRAVTIEAIHQPVVVQERPVPEPKSGEVLVKLHAAALNHRDVWVQKGLYPGMKLGSIMGSDGAGEVVSVGEGVSDALIGKAVVVNPSLGWGDNLRSYNPFTFSVLGMPIDGTFAEYICISATQIHEKPDHLSFSEAAALPLGGLTAYRSVFTRGNLQAGQKVLVTGIGGGVALQAVQFAIAAGAEVWVTSGDEEKIQKAIALGAKGGVNYKQPDWYKSLGLKAGLFDLIVDSAGGEAFKRLIDLANFGGKIVFYGGTLGNITDLPTAKVFFKQLDIHGSTMGNPTEFADMLAFTTKHNIRPVLDETFSLENTETALRKMEAGTQFGKIILKIQV